MAIIILCPEFISGGPEALHQLSFSATSIGQSAMMAYIGTSSKVRLDGMILKAQTNSPLEFKEYYKDYKPVAVTTQELSSNDWCIVPEVNADMATCWPTSKRAIWWLSVDNFQNALPQFQYPSLLRQLLTQENLLHLYQSNYAKDFLQRNGARNMLPLFDYTPAIYNKEEASQYLGCKRTDFSVFPRKGGELAMQFINLTQGRFSYSAIQGMSQEQVKNCLAESRIYIDFGNHPGKDRVPREAACMGNIIFLHEQGAACFYEDHPLDTFYLFTQLDVINGTLKNKIECVLKDPIAHFNQQTFYRHRIKMERNEFDLQVKMIFG